MKKNDKSENGNVSTYFLVIAIIVICIMAGGFYYFYNTNNNEVKKMQLKIDEQANTIDDLENKIKSINSIVNDKSDDILNNVTSSEEVKKITTGDELMSEAKIITASGWAGASNNVIGLKDGILYYYTISPENIEIIAEGVDDIYTSDLEENIIAIKGINFKEIQEKPNFVDYK